MDKQEISFIIYKEIGFSLPMINWITKHNNMVDKMGIDPYDAPSWQQTERDVKNFERNERNNTKLYRKLMLAYKNWKMEQKLNNMKTDF